MTKTILAIGALVFSGAAIYAGYAFQTPAPAPVAPVASNNVTGDLPITAPPLTPGAVTPGIVTVTPQPPPVPKPKTVVAEKNPKRTIQKQSHVKAMLKNL